MTIRFLKIAPLSSISLATLPNPGLNVQQLFDLTGWQRLYIFLGFFLRPTRKSLKMTNFK